MRKYEKKQAEDFVKLLAQAHEEVRRLIEGKDPGAAMALLRQCQEGAVEMGGLIERAEGEGAATIPLLEAYCETVYEIHEEIAGGQAAGAGKQYKRLRKALVQVENSIRSDIRARLEVAFLPYKASMWDSLESIWQTAEEDPDCDANVVPIPYYDREADGSLGTYHYEGDMLPSCVPVVHYSRYRMEEREPDVVYIHNPYDDMNYVTSVDPAYYSWELKKHTGCLVYVPYYATAGGMSDAQESCPAYYHADYIVIQAEKFRKFFDPKIPDRKFLVLGSPKFDSVIHKCQNPPEPPEEWKEKMAGRTVYFYNTSLAGMLGNTEVFLKKMRYVFDIFKGREDACLLWRPHPLLESTFDSMRKEYKPWFERLKREFIEEEIGIYDDTADMESTIALSDVYIGDTGSSVTSLFGVAGKPLFILNNNIDTLPGEDDWRGERVSIAFDARGDDRYQVTANNQLWYSEKNDYHYRFYMDLGSGYSGGRYYMKALPVGEKVYIIPRNAQHLLVIKNKKVRRIEFDARITQGGAFYSYYSDEKYIFLFPFRYPYLVRFNLKTEKIDYVDGIRQFIIREENGQWKCGGIGLYKNELVFSSPVDDGFLFMDKETLRIRQTSSNSRCNHGMQGIVPDGNELWLIPLGGMTIICWNPETGEVREYNGVPQGFRSIHWPYGYECEERPFGTIAFSREGGKENIVISPFWGNMYLTLDRESGKMEEWEPPVRFSNRGKNCYFNAGGMGGFVIILSQMGKGDCRIWYAPERRLYNINIDTKEYKEVEIVFDYNDLLEHEPGFMEDSEWIQYCLNENVLNSLKDFLDGRIAGNQFDRERQLAAFSKVNINTDGTCGRDIYGLIKEKVVGRGV